MKIAVFIFLLSLNAMAIEAQGNLEAQTRYATNNDRARENYGQDWDREQFSLFYGNLGLNQEFENSKIESNIFARTAQSKLYQKPFIAPMIYNFPQSLVARQMVDLKYDKQREHSYSELNMNKFLFEWNSSIARVSVGRIYLNYGLGEVFNPINPFNQATGLSSIAQTAQGNDGGQLRAFLTSKHTFDLIVLGDKELRKNEDRTSYTFFAHGEYRFNDDWQLDYVFGRDQERNKFGAQLSSQLSQGLLFTQFLYKTNRQDMKESSDDLLDLMVGYDQQLSEIWHMRVESGYQRRSDFAGLGFTERFLPVEYFVALVNQFEPHPLVKINITGIFDLDSQFNYAISKLIFSLSNDIEAELFASIPFGEEKQAKIAEQQFVSTDVGLALRIFF